MPKEVPKESKPVFVKYFPMYRMLTGSLPAAVALGRLIAWANLKPKFWKRDKELLKETGLTTREWQKAKHLIKAMPFIKTTIAGHPIRTWYEFDMDKLKEVLQLAEKAYCK